MSFQRLPLPTTDSEAPLPTGRGYAVTPDQHVGCPRGGMLVAGIDRYTGASVETCDGCNHYKVVSVTRAQAAAARAAAEQQAAEEAAALASTMSPAQLLANRATVARHERRCSCGCGQLLPARRSRYASPECEKTVRQQKTAASRAAPVRYCDCRCGRALKPHQTRFASQECSRQTLSRERRERLAAGHSQPQRVRPEPVCEYEGCGIAFPYSGTGRPARYCPTHTTSSTVSTRRYRERQRQRRAQEVA